MNYKKLLSEAKKQGIEALQVTSNKSNKISATVFHKELESYEVSSQSKIEARGIYKGKIGVASTEKLDNKAISFIIDQVKASASLNEKKEVPEIFKGSEKYHKKNIYNKALDEVPTETKINSLFELEKLAYKESEYVCDVECGYEEVGSESILANSYGLTLKNRVNYFYVYLQVICRKGEETKSSFDLVLDNDFTKLDIKKLVKDVVSSCVSKFDGISIPAKGYKCVLSRDAVASLLGIMVNSGFDAEAIQKKSSILAGKLNEKVFSSKVTIYEKPLEKNCFFTYFDDEGVATYNKTLVDKGVIKSYLYNLETAKKDNVSSTGNGYGSSKISCGTINLTLKPGKRSEEEVIAAVKDGVYIEGVTGLHSGLNPQSGDFSLEAEGYLIKDGKKSSALKLLTVGGNIYKVFADVTMVANNERRHTSSVSTCSVAVKELKISSL